jgi:hypothetical protein
MNTPKRQHFVPQMLLRRFSDPDGRLFFFSKRNPESGVHSGSVKTLFVERHLYSTVDDSGKHDVQLEKHFSNLKGRASELFDKIVSTARLNQIAKLTTDERHLWDEYFYYQWKRVPDFLNKNLTVINFESKLQESISKFEAVHRPVTDEELSNLSETKTIERIKKNAIVGAIADSGLEGQQSNLQGLVSRARKFGKSRS